MTSQSDGVKLSDTASGILDSISTMIWCFREDFMDKLKKKKRKSLIKEEEKKQTAVHFKTRSDRA